MRKFYLFFATVLMALAFAACGSDDEDVQAGNGGGQNKPDEIVPSKQVEIKISVLTGTDNLDHPVPRLVAEWGDNMFAQVVDPNHPEVTMFQYINRLCRNITSSSCTTIL